MGHCSPAPIPPLPSAEAVDADIHTIRKMQASDAMLVRPVQSHQSHSELTGFTSAIGPLGFMILGSMLGGGD